MTLIIIQYCTVSLLLMICIYSLFNFLEFSFLKCKSCFQLVRLLLELGNLCAVFWCCYGNPVFFLWTCLHCNKVQYSLACLLSLGLQVLIKGLFSPHVCFLYKHLYQPLEKKYPVLSRLSAKILNYCVRICAIKIVFLYTRCPFLFSFKSIELTSDNCTFKSKQKLCSNLWCFF